MMVVFLQFQWLCVLIGISFIYGQHFWLNHGIRTMQNLAKFSMKTVVPSYTMFLTFAALI